jgi:hypothetical protein
MYTQNNMKWAGEIVGTLILVVAWLWTHANPYVMGAVYTSTLLIGRGHYFPMVTLAEWALGRIEGTLAAQYLLGQVAGAALAVVATPVLDLTGKPVH